MFLLDMCVFGVVGAEGGGLAICYTASGMCEWVQQVGVVAVAFSGERSLDRGSFRESKTAGILVSSCCDRDQYQVPNRKTNTTAHGPHRSAIIFRAAALKQQLLHFDGK